MRTLGIVALGETPRDDVTPTLRGILGKGVRVIEAGGLDGLDAAGLDALRARAGEPPLETRLRSGQAIALSKPALSSRLASMAGRLTGECHAVMLLCSGEFPSLAVAWPSLIQPIHILRGVIRAVAAQRLLGIIGPASDLPAAPAQWAPYAPRVICAPASPYESTAHAVAAAMDLTTRGAEILFLDDMGFNESHRAAIAAATPHPVLCATTLTARVLRDIL